MCIHICIGVGVCRRLHLIQEGRQYIHQVPWLLGLPVACVVLTVLGLNALGDGIKEVIDPETRQ